QIRARDTDHDRGAVLALVGVVLVRDPGPNHLTRVRVAVALRREGDHHLRGGDPVPVVPILVGWLTTPHRTNGNTPINEPLVQSLVDAVHRATAGRNVCYIISGDLAHVGPAFSGDPLDDAAKNAIRLADADLFRILSTGDSRTFITKLLTDYEPNNVCGTFPAYLALRMMGDVKGEQVGYAQCPADEQGTSIVSVGGVVFR
ncbi:MAG TPA: MEMO1 family protein, partial [Anaerolineales bacterium]|nr:MEMO1 family protein [Anaerolineales bacterium]